MVTVDSILDWFTEAVERKMPIMPSTWVDAALKLNTLIDREHVQLFGLQQKVAELKVAKMEGGDSAAKAKVYVEATVEYTQMCLQRAKIERIEEFIRLAKVQARMADSELRNQ